MSETIQTVTDIVSILILRILEDEEGNRANKKWCS